MTFCFKSISTRSGKSVILDYGNNKYLFNCFEGLQRYFIEIGYKLNSINTFFLPSSISVIPFVGVYLTTSDAGKKYINIVTKHGKYLKNAEYFANRPQTILEIFDKGYNDELIVVEEIENNNSCNNYIINFNNIRGKFKASKAIQDKIPKNLYDSLCKKKIIKIDEIEYNGADYLEEDYKPCSVFLIIHSMSIDTLKEIVNTKKLDHFIILEREMILPILNNFPESKCFYFEDNNEIEFICQFNAQKLLNNVDKNFHFSLPKNTNCLPHKNYNNVISIKSRGYIEYDKTTQKYSEYNPEKIYDLFVNENNYRAFTNDGVIFLGTGSALPSKNRNVTSILFEGLEDAILMDVGEDTISQIDRFYGSLEVCKKIHTIYISHSHADHHLGLVSVIRKILKSRSTVRLLSPPCVYDFTKLYIEDGIEFYTTVLFEPRKKFYDVYDLQYIHKYEFSDVKIDLCPVNHCLDSCAAVFYTKNRSIAYSGDCRPSKLFARMSKNVDLMIHECTFDDILEQNAKKTKHSTYKEALSVFEQSRSKQLILTHFSQRYPKNINTQIKYILAFDFYRYDFKKIDNNIIAETHRIINEEND